VSADATREDATPLGQRARLVDAMIELSAQHGYAGARVAEVAARAGVSRATFYELFTDKEQCLLRAHELLAARMAGEVDAAIGDLSGADALRVAATALVRIAAREPDAFNLLTHEALTAGPNARAHRDRLLDGMATSVERAVERAPDDAEVFDIPARIALGGVVRLVGMSMRRDGADPEGLLPDLLRWIDSYAAPARAARRLKITVDPALAAAVRERQLAPTLPRSLPRGRHRLPADVVDGIQRERIAYATAAVVAARDTTSIAVSDIVSAAGLSRETFYSYFRDKEEAFLATHQLIFEQLMAACAAAFFTPDEPWPRRMWNSGLAYTALFAAQPTFAHFGFISAYAIGDVGVRRVDETILAFGLFLEDGYRHRPAATKLPRLVSDAIAAAIMETASHQVRRGGGGELPGLLPISVYTALAPFMGAPAAGSFIDRMVRQTLAR
jgi:AcrR family transcriptional regulator